jgi:PAS domain S-box-containing protein
MLPLRWNRLGGRLLLAFLLIVAVNLAAIAVIQVFQQRLDRFAEHRERDLEVESRIEAYLDAIQELSRGLFMVAADQSDVGRALVLESEERLATLDDQLATITWEESVIEAGELGPCLAIRRELGEVARRILSLVGALETQRQVLSAGQRAEMNAALDIALDNAAVLAEHADLYVVELVDELHAHAQRTLAENARLTRWTSTVTLAAASVSLGFALVIALVLARSLVTRLAALARVVDAFGRGDLSQRVREHGSDEIADLGRTFDHMADAIQTQDALRMSKQYVDDILDTMTNALVVLDGQAVIEKVNRATCQLLGFDERELVGARAERIFGLFSEATHASAPVPWQGDMVQNAELALTTKRGDIRTVAFASATMTDRHGTKIVCLLDDITERKELIFQLVEAKRTAESATKAKTTFLANMSHELRTPLNAILGYAQILVDDGNLTERQRDAIATMRVSGEHLARLLEDLLDISKIEADRMELQPSEFHLSRFLDDLVGLFRMRAQQKGLLFRYEVLSELPAVRADERRLRQVLINLLGNAIKFTERGGVTLKAYVRQGRMRFEVEDSGIGIAPDLREDIFAPFRQGGPPQRRVEGTGLGLAISKRLVELMGGEIGVHSTPGHGSTFWVDLALPAVSGWREADSGVYGPVQGYGGPRRRILLVDDEAANRTMLAQYLVPLGFDIDEAANGKEALERVDAHAPDVVLMDVRMPVMDGLAATRALRKRPAGQDLVILAISASAFDDDREDCLRAGCDGFLAKPMHLDALLAQLGALLDLAWLRTEPLDDAEPSDVDTTIWELPPISDVAALLAAAQQGDIKALRDVIDRVDGHAAAYAPFCEELRTWAKQYRLKQIRMHLEELLATMRGASPASEADAGAEAEASRASGAAPEAQAAPDPDAEPR